MFIKLSSCQLLTFRPSPPQKKELTIIAECTNAIKFLSPANAFECLISQLTFTAVVYQ